MKVLAHINKFFATLFFNRRFRLAKWTRTHPWFGNWIKKVAFDGDDISVVPKAGTAHKVVDLNINIDNAGERNVVPSDLVKNVLMKAEKIFLMNFCLCRKANKCKDFSYETGCIFVGKGTDNIPKDFGRFVTSEEACAFIDECDRLGLVHIIGRNKIDSVWMRTGSHLDLMTICNCCPCCCLWNMARDISGDISAAYKRMKGVTVSVLAEKCIGCGICMERCFVKAIQIVGGKIVLDDNKCRACGRCSVECPKEVIRLEYDPNVIEEESERIFNLVNHA